MTKKHLPLFIFLFVIVSFVVVASPQKAIAAVTHVVISQIQVSGATATDEFVELYNPTGNTIDLTGYRLTKRVASGTQSTLVASMSGILSPNQYFLIKHPTGYVGNTTSDSQYSTSSSITADNIVILYSDAGTTTADKVGFGSAFDSETFPFDTNPTAGQSLIRVNNQDTDDNSLDFEILQTSSPRNSSTVSGTPVQTSTPIPTLESTPTPTPIQTEMPTPSATPTSTPSPTETSTPTPASTASPTPSPTVVASPTPKIQHDSKKDHDHNEIRLPFGFKCKVEKHEFEFKHHRFKYFKFHFLRR